MHRSFHELGRLCEDWEADPAWWDPPWWRRPMRPVLVRLPRERRERPRRMDLNASEQGESPE